MPSVQWGSGNMFDLNTVPKINIQEISYKDIDISTTKTGPHFDPYRYYLYNKGSRWMMLDTYKNKEIKVKNA